MSIINLPVEIVGSILSYLGDKSIQAMAMVSGPISRITVDQTGIHKTRELALFVKERLGGGFYPECASLVSTRMAERLNAGFAGLKDLAEYYTSVKCSIVVADELQLNPGELLLVSRSIKEDELDDELMYTCIRIAAEDPERAIELTSGVSGAQRRSQALAMISVTLAKKGRREEAVDLLEGITVRSHKERVLKFLEIR